MDTEIWILHKFCVTNHILPLILFQPFTKVKAILGPGPSWNRHQVGHVPRAVVAKPCARILWTTQALTCLQSVHLARGPAHRAQFSSSLNHVWLFATPRTAARQASLSITNSRSLLKLMSIESVMPSNHLILRHPLLLPPSVFSRIRVFSNESVLHIRWPKYWSFSFSISPSNEHPGLISFRRDWLDLLAVQGTLESLQHHSSRASILWHSAFFNSNSRILTWLLENHSFD